eukprot:scaffold3201_cov116-Isochrysis_galbana.AAC.3
MDYGHTSRPDLHTAPGPTVYHQGARRGRPRLPHDNINSDGALFWFELGEADGEFSVGLGRRWLEVGTQEPEQLT